MSKISRVPGSGQTIKGLIAGQVMIGVLAGSLLWAAAVEPVKKSPPDRPGVETKIKQVPAEGSLPTPFWKVYWEKAREAVLQKRYPEAISFFRQALSLKPNLDEARLELIQVLEAQEKWTEAIVELEQVAEHQPLNLKIQRKLADLLSQVKEHRRAVERYQWILHKEPDNLAVRLGLAQAYFALNENERALLEWRQVLIRDPLNYEARVHIVEGLFAARRLDESIQILESLVKQYPKQPGLKKKLAQALVMSQKFKEALPHLQELSRQEPGDMDVQLWLGQVLAAVKSYDQSLPYLETYLKKKPDSASALLEKARALLNTGNYPQALEIYERLRKSRGEDPDLRREMAEAYLTAGRIPEAISEFRALALAFPGEKVLQERIGLLYLRLKNFDQAIPFLEQALALDPENGSVQAALGKAYHSSGQKEKAVSVYRDLLAKKRADLAFRMELAELLFETQHFDESFAVYREIVRERPEFWEARYKLAAGMYRQKAYGQAAEELDLLVRQQPEHAGIWNLTGYNALERGDYPLAQKAFRKAMLLGEDRAEPLLRLGEVYRLLEQPWKGNGYLDWALEIKPGDSAVLIEKALCLIDGGGLSQAQRILESLAKKESGSFRFQQAWARLLASQNRKDECEAAWAEMETTFPEQQFSIFQDRAAYYAALGKWDWVLTALKAASAKNPLHLEVRRKLGRLLLQMDRTEEAEQFFRRLEKEGVLLEEAYWGQASLFLRRGRLDEAKERFWKALNRSASSIPVRYWLNWIYDRQAGTPSLAAQLEETLMNYSRLTEGGILSLAETYRSHEAWPKALPLYREILERGEDDEILLAATRIRDFLLKTGNLNEARDLLEDLQKRFPRNQKISRQLVQIYALRKEYGQAIRVLDGLLKQEDPRDPVLIVQKARLLEKWNKHGSSQDTYQQMLEPTVDRRLKEKIGALLDRLDPPLRTQVGQGMPDNPEETVFAFYEDTARRVDLAETGSFWKGLAPVVRELKTAALIQKKIYLEKEAKDRLWKNMYFQSRPFLETLKALDSDNEEVDADLMRSYRGQ